MTKNIKKKKMIYSKDRSANSTNLFVKLDDDANIAMYSLKKKLGNLSKKYIIQTCIKFLNKQNNDTISTVIADLRKEYENNIVKK